MCEADISHKYANAKTCSIACNSRRRYRNNLDLYRRLSRESAKRYAKRHPDRVKATISSWRARNRRHLREYARLGNIARRRKPKSIMECLYCGASISERNTNTKYCSKSCSGNARRSMDVDGFRERQNIYCRNRYARSDEFRKKCRDARNRRRARRAHAIGDFTSAEFALIVRKQRGKCAECGKERKLEADHIVPLSQGGSGFAFNIQGLCKPCNCRKGAKIREYAHPSLFDRAVA
jgi:5-methylcytosine-specific restriction endonuclease McrA